MNNTSSQNDEIPLLTFNSLYNILREEKKSKPLQKLPEKFYVSLAQFLEQKKSELVKLKNNDEKDKYKKERFVLNNSKKIIDELISLRASKIAEVGIKNTIYDEDFLSEDNILDLEDKFLKNITQATVELKDEALKKDGK